MINFWMGTVFFIFNFQREIECVVSFVFHLLKKELYNECTLCLYMTFILSLMIVASLLQCGRWTSLRFSKAPAHALTGQHSLLLTYTGNPYSHHPQTVSAYIGQYRMQLYSGSLNTLAKNPQVQQILTRLLVQVMC